MTEELNQDPYHIDLMRTLWENTYRGTVFDYKEQYVATIRLILSIPLDRSEIPQLLYSLKTLFFLRLKSWNLNKLCPRSSRKKYQVNIFNQTVLCTFTQALLMVQKQQIEM